MANGRNKGRKGDSGRDGGGFVALPWSVLDCPAYAALSHPARALLLEIARQWVRDNNGQLLASRAHLAKRGWKSADVIQRAKNELLAAGFIHQTVQGQRPNKASWYALTWYVLDRHPDYDYGAVETFERGAYRKGTPPLKNARLSPSGGTVMTSTVPPDGTKKAVPVPSGGTIGPVSAALSVPPDGHHLEMPSAAPKMDCYDSPAGRHIRLQTRPIGLFSGLLTNAAKRQKVHIRVTAAARAQGQGWTPTPRSA